METIAKKFLFDPVDSKVYVINPFTQETYEPKIRVGSLEEKKFFRVTTEKNGQTCKLYFNSEDEYNEWSALKNNILKKSKRSNMFPLTHNEFVG